MSRRWTDEREEILRALWAHRYSLEAIALELRVSTSAVVNKAQRLDLPARRDRHRPDHSSKRGAEILCEALRAHWALAGHPEVDFRVEVAARRAGVPIYGVRSNLVNGLPRDAAE